jgi:polyphosphate kinase
LQSTGPTPDSIQEAAAEESTGPRAILAAGLDLSDPSLLINRELSQLRFFARVLEEAEDESVPLLERIKFLSILGSIMSEFLMVRVAGLKAADSGGDQREVAGWSGSG